MKALNIYKFILTLVITCDKANKINWYDDKQNLIATNFNFGERFVTKFSVKNLNCPYITFKLTGEFGEKNSKKFVPNKYD